MHRTPEHATRASSFPRSAWERSLPLRGAMESTARAASTASAATRSVGDVRSHAERGNEGGDECIRRGMTLVELLVVIIILTTVVAAAIPLLSPARDDRRLREASRGVNTFISGAIAKAAVLRRPYGVALKKLSEDTQNDDDNGVCLELYYVEQPPAFRGFGDTSSARVALNTEIRHANYPLGTVLIQFVVRGTAQPQLQDGLPNGWDFEAIPPSTIRPGDVIEVGGSRYVLLQSVQNNSLLQHPIENGGFYEINPDNPSAMIVGFPVEGSGQLRKANTDSRGWQTEARRLLDPTTGQFVNATVVADSYATMLPDRLVAPNPPQPPYWTEPARYSILRQPKAASGEPYQLPEGIAIDLRGSGITIDTTRSYEPRVFFHHPEPVTIGGTIVRIDNREPIVIMFTPEGLIERVRYSLEPYTPTVGGEMVDQPLVSNVYLLIGRRENSPPPDIGADPALGTVAANLPDTELQEIMAPINWLNLESRWVVIGSQSGRVTSADNAFVDLRAWSGGANPLYPMASPVEKRAMQVHAAREFAIQMQQVGGR